MSGLPVRTPSKLAAVAICFNEERDLPGFIDHLLPWVDEVVLVDSGSTDATLAIAADRGDRVRVVHRVMGEGGFAAQRNAGIDAASSDWLLHMDIDERVTPELAQEIRSEIADTTHDGYRYRRLNFFLHRPMHGGGWQNWNNVQLARRGAHRFEREIHELCVVDGTVGQLNGLMWHYNDENYGERMEKSGRYCRMVADELLESGRIVKSRDLLIQPVVRFANLYLRHRGFRDGTPGLLAALHSATATFRSFALAWNEQNDVSREEVEEAFAQVWKSAYPSGILSSPHVSDSNPSDSRS